MFELTYRNKKVTELTDIQSQKVHTGGTKFAKKNKHTDLNSTKRAVIE